MNKITFKLDTSDLPKKWYNVKSDLPQPLPPAKDPEDGPSRIEKMKKIRPKILQQQEESEERWIDIPDDIQEKYLMVGRPTPLQRAIELERYLDTPARIYYKREDILPTGSFKLNTSIPQIYYAKKDGYEGITSETGAGQWGCALAISCSFYNMRSVIYMANVSYHQKSYRRIYMQLFNTEVIPSPSDKTEAGKNMIKEYPNHPGSIGSGISEAVENALKDSTLCYLSGSNLAHVLMHQTVIGLETKKQLELIGEKPDQLIACMGAGSNVGGLMFPFLRDKLNNSGVDFIAVESSAVPRLTKGEYRYDYGDSTGLTPLIKSYTLGMNFVPPSIHSGGLRQHCGSPLVGLLHHLGLIDAIAYSQEEAFESGRLFAKVEGVLPAPEACHATKAVIDSALDARKKREKRVIVTCISGHGLLDLQGYDKVFLQNNL